MKKNLVMVFGVFDGLHPGHLSFLKQAKRYGKKLIVVVARDKIVVRRKRRKPVYNEKARLAHVRKSPLVNLAFLGDFRDGSYGVITKYRPDIICLGYDQRILWNDLKKRMRRSDFGRVRLIRLKPYRPDEFKSSRLNHVKQNPTI